jgi:hypothetical protein
MGDKVFYVYRVTVVRLDGSRRSAVVKTTKPETDPDCTRDALLDRLGTLRSEGAIKGSSISIPATVGPRQRQSMARWTVTLPMLVEVPA